MLSAASPLGTVTPAAAQQIGLLVFTPNNQGWHTHWSGVQANSHNSSSWLSINQGPKG